MASETPKKTERIRELNTCNDCGRVERFLFTAVMDDKQIYICPSCMDYAIGDNGLHSQYHVDHSEDNDPDYLCECDQCKEDRKRRKELNEYQERELKRMKERQENPRRDWVFDEADKRWHQDVVDY